MTLYGSLYPWVTVDWEINDNILRHKTSGMRASISKEVIRFSISKYDTWEIKKIKLYLEKSC